MSDYRPIEYPKMLYRCPGPHAFHGGLFAYRIVPDAQAEAQASASGWCRTTAEALERLVEPLSPDPGEALATVRHWLGDHAARFTTWGAEAGPDSAGWRRSTLECETYYVLPKAWAAEVCAGLDHRAVAAELVARGWLRLDGEGQATRVSVPKRGQVRCHVLVPGAW